MSDFADFLRIARPLAPQTAVVLGSGLGGVAVDFREAVSIAFGDVPSLVPPSVHGHGGRIALGLWGDVSALLFLGRLHFYEGHPIELVTVPVRVAAELGVRRLILTNAAGGIHRSLDPGSLMAIRGHIKLFGPNAWRSIADGNPSSYPYAPRLLARMTDLHAGVYAALTGPCYETPAEIRALSACGADAVGMSTALEAETAIEFGLEVAAISCITNRAAGLGGDTLDHAEVLANAQLAVERMRDVVGRLVGMS